MTAKSGSRS